MDLTFKSDNKTFGGILIRGIKEVSFEDSEMCYSGPRKCVDVLWPNADAFKTAEYPVIEASNSIITSSIYSLPRKITIRGSETRESKVERWLKSLKRKGIIPNNINYSIRELAELIFDSKYRFIKPHTHLPSKSQNLIFKH